MNDLGTESEVELKNLSGLELMENLADLANQLIKLTKG